MTDMSMRKIIPLLLLSGALHTSLAYADFAAGLNTAEKKDFATAVKEWQPLAAKGDGSAQADWATMYKKGQGVPKNKVIACALYTLAASSNAEGVKANFVNILATMSVQSADAVQNLAHQMNVQGKLLKVIDQYAAK